MPWMLQPHNYSQIIRPNLYRVDYRRVGAYQGMGQSYQSLYLPFTDPTYMAAHFPAVAAIYGRPATTRPQPLWGGLGQGAYCDDAGNCFDASSNLVQAGYGSYGGMVKVPAGTTMVPTGGSNYLPWILGGIVVLALFAGGRR